jgi:EAL domain-containing protein (putative c-di-GMP-specific phosphodiesterase class I)
MGITVAIDDFGTGHSSLAYLRESPVGSIIDLARHLLVPVVAEGLEDDETAARLRSIGGALGQGYVFSNAP